MRRTLAGLTAAAIGVAAAGLILADGRPSQAAVPAVNPQLSPPAGQVAVRSGQAVTFGGETTPGSLKVSAHILFEAANGSEFRDPMNVTAQLEIADNGAISGSRTLPSLSGGHDGNVFLSVTALDPNDGQEATGVSNGVPIDLVAPFISEVRLTAPDTVKVRFNEDVHLPTQQDLGADWRVDGVNAATASQTPGDPSERTLTILNLQDEDATPEVVYRVGAGLVVGRESYRDDSAGNVYSGDTHFTARDLIPPVIPDIDMVAGKAVADPVAAMDPTPQIDLSNINEGHVAEIYRESNGTPGLQRPGDAFVGDDEADSSGTAQVTVDDLGDDGTYTFYAIARDQAACNPQDEPADQVPCPNRSDTDAGATVNYRLDRLAPVGVFAAATAADTVVVGFTEPVFPADGTAADWQVPGAVPTTVAGSGNQRELTVTGAPTIGSTVLYTGTQLKDEAGNTLSFSETLGDAIPPLVSITDPVDPKFVAGSTYTIRGTTDLADTVQIFRDNDGDGVRDNETVVASGPVAGDKTWAISAPLTADPAENGFVARGVRTSPAVTGPDVRVDGVITRDSVNPTVEVTDINGAFRGGQAEIPINWDANDANPGAIRLEWSANGGSTWQLIADGVAFDGDPFDWPVPEADTTAARIRVTAVDKAGRQSSAMTGQFEIDSTAPVFTAVTLDSRRIRVDFSERVHGLFFGGLTGHWRVRGQPINSISPTGSQGPPGHLQATLTIGSSQPDIGTKETPTVTYEHPLLPLNRLRDHVDIELATLEVTAADGILCDIVGTNQNDVLVGTNQPEVFCPLAGNDQIIAMGGDDVVLSGIGNKTVDGGPGNDEIHGGPGNDHLIGGTGNDVILGAAGNDIIEGGIGDDVMDAGDGDDSVIGSAGNDLVKAGEGNDAVDGSEGNDHLDGGPGDDVLLGGPDHDTLLGQDGNDRLDGGPGDDLALGGAGFDVLIGSQGHDLLRGDTQNDVLRGGTGKDRLFGDAGKDRLAGGGGKDKLNGGGGKDKLNGGGGKDKLNGGGGKDKCNGGPGRDRVRRCEGGKR